jgi:hypothetical protein
MPWYQSFPPADAYVPCAGQWHEIQFHNGELQLPGHPDAEAELVLAALGGDIPECVEVAQAWNHRKTDVGLLMVLPRSAQDRITVSWNDIETFESPQRGAVTLSGGAAMSIPTSLPPNAPQGFVSHLPQAGPSAASGAAAAAGAGARVSGASCWLYCRERRGRFARREQNAGRILPGARRRAGRTRRTRCRTLAGY